MIGYLQKKRISDLLKTYTNGLGAKVLIYTITEFLGKGISFALVPVMAVYLSPGEFGTVSNFNAFHYFLLPLLLFNSNSFLSIEYHKADRLRKFEILNSIYIYAFIICFLLLFILLIFQTLLVQILKLDFKLILLALLYTFSVVIFTNHTTYLRMREETIKYSSTNLFIAIGTATLSISLVAFFKFGVYGRILGIVAPPVLALFYIGKQYKNNRIQNFGISIKEIKSIFYYGLPLLPHSFSFWLRSGADRIIISNYVSIEANGVYSLASTVSSGMLVFSTAFFSAFNPHLFKTYSRFQFGEDSAENLRKNSKILFSFLLLYGTLCIVLYAIYRFFLIDFFDIGYKDSSSYLSYLLIIAFLNATYSAIIPKLFYLKDNKIISSITFGSSIVHIGLSLWLVQDYGVEGILYSSLIITMLIVILLKLRSNKLQLK